MGMGGRAGSRAPSPTRPPSGGCKCRAVRRELSSPPRLDTPKCTEGRDWLRLTPGSRGTLSPHAHAYTHTHTPCPRKCVHIHTHAPCAPTHPVPPPHTHARTHKTHTLCNMERQLWGGLGGRDQRPDSGHGPAACVQTLRLGPQRSARDRTGQYSHQGRRRPGAGVTGWGCLSLQPRVSSSLNSQPGMTPATGSGYSGKGRGNRQAPPRWAGRGRQRAYSSVW